jgi:hypothetical protein
MPIHVDTQTSESVAARAPARWLAHYSDPSFRFFDGRTAGEIAPLVEALKAAPTPENVARVLNQSWVRTDNCDACGSDDGGPRVCLTADHDSSDRSMCLCEVCAHRMRAALSRALAKIAPEAPNGGDGR